MKEREWVSSIMPMIKAKLSKCDSRIKADYCKKLPYSLEVLSYSEKKFYLNDKSESRNVTDYETDMLIYEEVEDKIWKPRVIIEAKLGNITSHDAITYSQKAYSHKFVHPYLRYGILIGNRGNKALPGLLFRHGLHFDFMFSQKSHDADKVELKNFIDIIIDEIDSSRKIEQMLYGTRLRSRQKYSFLHRQLKLCCFE